MDLATAKAALRRMVAADQEPTLDDEALEGLLLQTAYTASDAVVTYRLGKAAKQGWLAKAALVAGRYDYAGDGLSFRRSQMLAQFMTMAQHYGRSSSSLGDLRIPLLTDAQRLVEYGAADSA